MMLCSCVLTVNKQKTADSLLRFTGGFHTKVDSPPVNLSKPIKEIKAAAYHLRSAYLDNLLIVFNHQP